MKKIKVGDLRKYGKDSAKEDVVLDIGEMKIGVKQHTSIMDKLDFAARVYNDCVTEDNETHLISSLLLNVSLKTTLVRRYTNLTLPEDGIEAYNLITNTGLYNEIYENISDIEIEELKRVVEEYIGDKQEKYNQEYNIGYIAKRLIGTIADMIPDIDDLNGIISSVKDVAGLDEGKIQDITNNVTSILDQKEGK